MKTEMGAKDNWQTKKAKHSGMSCAFGARQTAKTHNRGETLAHRCVYKRPTLTVAL